jgi:hypothetical protein
MGGSHDRQGLHEREPRGDRPDAMLTEAADLLKMGGSGLGEPSEARFQKHQAGREMISSSSTVFFGPIMDSLWAVASPIPRRRGPP